MQDRRRSRGMLCANRPVGEGSCAVLASILSVSLRWIRIVVWHPRPSRASLAVQGFFQKRLVWPTCFFFVEAKEIQGKASGDYLAQHAPLPKWRVLRWLVLEVSLHQGTRECLYMLPHCGRCNKVKTRNVNIKRPDSLIKKKTVVYLLWAVIASAVPAYIFPISLNISWFSASTNLSTLQQTKTRSNSSSAHVAKDLHALVQKGRMLYVKVWDMTAVVSPAQTQTARSSHYSSNTANTYMR